MTAVRSAVFPIFVAANTNRDMLYLYWLNRNLLRSKYISQYFEIPLPPKLKSKKAQNIPLYSE